MACFFLPTATLYGDVGDEEERLAFLDKVFEMGCTFWDTAEVCMRLWCRVERWREGEMGC